MSTVPFAYRAAMRAVRVAAPLFEGGRSKLARGLAGRRGAEEVLANWGANERDPTRPAIWLHAPSVGEALQAGAVLGELTAGRPGLQAAFTHFSPSAEGIGARIGAGVSAYLPWDIPESIGRALDAVRPDVLAFAKTEVWPVLVEEAARRGVSVALVAATVPADAGRLRWPARSLLRKTWASLTLACACSEVDGKRLVELGVPASRVRITGDPGVDAAAARAAAADAASRTLAPFHAEQRPTIVAGSTWPADEAALLPALDVVRRSVKDVRAIVVPHEPTPERVGELSTRLAASGWRVSTLADVEARGSAVGADAVVVERVGVLAGLYTVADVAYVGGGFGTRGLHSVVEPAAAGVPVAVGPRHQRSAACVSLVRNGGARSALNQAALGEILRIWLLDTGLRRRAAEQVFVYIEEHRGAARRTADLLDPLFTVRSRA